MITSLLNGGFSLVVVYSNKYMSELSLAYSEYLERMYAQSDDLVEVDIDTVPDGVPVSLSWLEWGNFS